MSAAEGRGSASPSLGAGGREVAVDPGPVTAVAADTCVAVPAVPPEGTACPHRTPRAALCGAQGAVICQNNGEFGLCALMFCVWLARVPVRQVALTGVGRAPRGRCGRRLGGPRPVGKAAPALWPLGRALAGSVVRMYAHLPSVTVGVSRRAARAAAASQPCRRARCLLSRASPGPCWGAERHAAGRAPASPLGAVLTWQPGASRAPLLSPCVCTEYMSPRGCPLPMQRLCEGPSSPGA